MSYSEKSTWIMMIVVTVTYLFYINTILGRVETMPFADVAYAGALIWTIGIIIIAAIVIHIVVAVASPEGIDVDDPRDRQIEHFGEHFGQWVTGGGSTAALIMAMIELDHFWIANVIYLAFVLSTLVGGAAKIHAYRRGLHGW